MAGDADAPCLVEWFPLEGVQPQMLERICWASLGRAEISPDLSLVETVSCPDLLGTPLPVQPSVSADSMAWAGEEWDLEEKLEFGLLLDAVEEELCGALWLSSDCSSSSSCPGFWGGGNGSRTAWVT